MKKSVVVMVILLLGLTGCVCKKNKKVKKPKKKVEAMEQVNIPVARSYFDDSDNDVNLGEFVLVDDSIGDELESSCDLENAVESNDVIARAVEEKELDLSEDLDDDFSWVQEIEQEDKDFETVYFDFDKYEIREGQEEVVENNSVVAKDLVDEGGDPKIVVEGHACHSAGSRTYNLALSERRAKVVADRIAASGIPRENIKVVPRGQECPALDVKGTPITGDKDNQALNRRAEVRVVYS